jgi:sporulation protein YlmC with PRC-barrel domain
MVFLSTVQGDDFSYEIDGHVLGEVRDSMVDILTEKVITYLGTPHQYGILTL